MRDHHLPGRSPVYATHGMAATSMPAATLTALDVLRAGGNALDAAVAATAVLCVIEPQSTGIGGDCFCLYAPAGAGKVFALNGSGRAPAAATIDWYEQHGISALENTSAHAVTVPGAVNAWETLLKAHGRKGLDELLQPAIRFAADGWPVHPIVAWSWKRLETKLRKNGTNNTHAFLPNGAAPKAGDIFRNQALAETLRAVARHGAKAFYEGAVAADIVATLRARGGLHTEEDFAAGLTNAEFVEPITLNWRGYDVYQCPPNGQGIIALMILGMLGGLPSAADGPLGAQRFHRHIEAARLAYRDRDAFVADPSQTDVPVKKLLSTEYLSGLRALIDDGKAIARSAIRRRDAAAAASRHDLPLRGRSGRQRVQLHQFAVRRFRFGDPGRALRRHAAEPRLRLPRRARPSELHRSAQAADAHDHPRHGDEGRSGCDAVWRDGRPLPADGPLAVPHQHAGIRPRYPGGARPAAAVPVARQGAARARHPARHQREAGATRPRRGNGGTPAWRRPGDLDRSRARLPRRWFRPTQGRAALGY